MVKQCCYCRRVYRDEGAAGDFGARGLWVLPGRAGEGRVSHGICAPCLAEKMAALAPPVPASFEDAPVSA